MRIGLLLVLVADEALDVGIRGTLPVLIWYVGALEDGEANFELVLRLTADIPHFANIARLGCRIDIDPHIDHTLIHLRAHMVKLSRLNWLLVQCLPLRVEESIIKVNGCLSDEVVTEQQVVIVCFNFERRSSREVNRKVKSLHELGVWLVVLIVVAVVIFSVTAPHDEVGVTSGADVSRRELVPLNQVHMSNRLGFLSQEVLNHAAKGHVFHEIDQGGKLESYPAKVFLKCSLVLAGLHAVQVEVLLGTCLALVQTGETIEDLCQQLFLLLLKFCLKFIVDDLDSSLELSDDLHRGGLP